MLRSLLAVPAFALLVSVGAKASHPNDSCSTPLAVNGVGTFAFDTSGATNSPAIAGDCDAALVWLEDMWEIWTAPETGLATLSMCGAVSFDARFAVYEGSACPTQPAVVCAADVCGLDPSATFPVFGGRSYLIRIGSHYVGGSGAGSYSLTLAPGLWDRSLGTPQITPASVPGTYDITMRYLVYTVGSIAPGSDLSAVASLVIDGVALPGSGTTVGAPAIVIGGSDCQDVANCGGPCTHMISLAPDTCQSYSFVLFLGLGGGVTGCACGPRMDLGPLFGFEAQWFGIPLAPTSTVEGEVVAPVGTLPEFMTSNDRSASAVPGAVAVPFCFGDGSGTACPCGNNGITGNGCASSVNPNGANLSATGIASIAADTLILNGVGMANSSALYFQGTSQISSVFGDGLRCAGGAVLRLGTKINVAGSSQYPVGGDSIVSVRGLVTTPGMRTYQTWYRNAAAFCTVSTFNLTNGISVSWTP